MSAAPCEMCGGARGSQRSARCRRERRRGRTRSRRGPHRRAVEAWCRRVRAARRRHLPHQPGRGRHAPPRPRARRRDLPRDGVQSVGGTRAGRRCHLLCRRRGERPGESTRELAPPRMAHTQSRRASTHTRVPPPSAPAPCPVPLPRRPLVVAASPPKASPSLLGCRRDALATRPRQTSGLAGEQVARRRPSSWWA